MISKEEIEKAKKTLYPLSVGDFITWFNADGVVEVEIAVENLLEAYKQLENKQQKVIDYLEKEIEENRKCMNKTNIKLDKLHYMKRIEYAKEILEIMRGEE